MTHHRLLSSTLRGGIVKFKYKLSGLTAIGATLLSTGAIAVPFSTEMFQGSFDSTITAGFGRRTGNQSCDLIGHATSSCSADSVNTAQYSNGDNGNLNYNKGDFFAANIRGTHELLLKLPDGYKFLARGTWLYDFAATQTARSALENDAKTQLARDVRLLDFWVSKDFLIGGQTARLRLGNQVLNWGESVYTAGGINVTNSLDLQKLAIPGTQIKEAVIPAPMISFASSLGNGLSIDSYYQFRWNRNRVPPTGSYFSASDIFDKGREPLYLNTNNYNVGAVDAAYVAGSRNLAAIHQAQTGLVNGDFAGPPNSSLGFPFVGDKTPKNTGQYGLALHFKPEGKALDLGVYYLNYHDKSPVVEEVAATPFRWDFLQNRKLFGVSANFPVGDWALGWELSYRPKDAVALGGCFTPGAALDANVSTVAGVNCQQWIDKQKYQMHLTGQLGITPANYASFLNLLGGASSATLTTEAVMIRYPGVSPNARYTRTMDGVQVTQAPAAGYAFWTDNSTNATLGYPIAAGAGTANSFGVTADFNWTYDGKLISGWQVTPGVTFSAAVKGDTPTLAAPFLQGAKSANYYLLLTQNSGKWNAGLNYTAYWGGDKVRQPFGDRDFLGGFLAYNF